MSRPFLDPLGVPIVWGPWFFPRAKPDHSSLSSVEVKKSGAWSLLYYICLCDLQGVRCTQVVSVPSNVMIELTEAMTKLLVSPSRCWGHCCNLNMLRSFFPDVYILSVYHFVTSLNAMWCVLLEGYRLINKQWTKRVCVFVASCWEC